MCGLKSYEKTLADEVCDIVGTGTSANGVASDRISVTPEKYGVSLR